LASVTEIETTVRRTVTTIVCVGVIMTFRSKAVRASERAPTLRGHGDVGPITAGVQWRTRPNFYQSGWRLP
jgi:hypothetical protein